MTYHGQVDIDEPVAATVLAPPDILERKKWLSPRTVLGILVSVAFSALVLRGIRWQVLGASLRDANVLFIAAAAVTFAAITVILSLRWRILLGAHAVGGADAFAVFSVGAFLNLVLPLRGGDVVRIFLMRKRSGLTGSHVVASMVIEKLLDVVTLVVLALTAVFVVDLPRWFAISLSLASGCVLCGAAVCVFIERSGMTRVPSFARGRLPSRIVAMLDTLLLSFHQGLHVLRSPRKLVQVILLSFAGWASMALAAFFVVRGVHIVHVTFFSMIVVVAMINLGLVIPSSPGAIGTYEFLGVTALALFNVAREPALDAILVLHAEYNLIAAITGLVTMAILGLSLGQSMRDS